MTLQDQLLYLLHSLKELLFLFLKPPLFIPILIILLFHFKKKLSLFFSKRKYKNSSYYQITKLPYHSVRHDSGRYGEYLTYKNLENFENEGAKFLFNIYLPKEDGKTTEIDILMISSKGIFVFESKNYSGWIFGSEEQKNWYQTLATGRGKSHKEHFYNPIMQNRSHIKYLKAFLGEQIPMRSIIVFSDRCKLKNIKIKSNDICVVNRYNVAPVVSGIFKQTPNDLLNETEINNLFNKLYPYTQVDENIKKEHVDNINHDLNPQYICQTAPQEEQTIEPFAERPQIDNTVTSIANNEKTKIEVTEIQSPENLETPTNEFINNEPQMFKCPKCNGHLILRTATRGTNSGKQFYGCSNYPKCRYIQSI